MAAAVAGRTRVAGVRHQLQLVDNLAQEGVSMHVHFHLRPTFRSPTAADDLGEKRAGEMESPTYNEFQAEFANLLNSSYVEKLCYLLSLQDG
ncbi:hypothetical protein BaRGS_00025863, partial [Batillaria attramentaria]